jgi:citrate lyase beta subunit
VTTPVTFLFVPAHEERKVDKAFEAGSDAVILDLEDSVPDDRKAAARVAVRNRLARAAANTNVWVRVNGAGNDFEEDVQSLDWSRVAGVVLPKVELPSAVATLERAGVRRLLLLIESAAGLEALPALARTTVMVCTAIGTWDLALDLGLTGIDDPDQSELIWHVRRELVVRSRAANLPPPIDGVFTAIDDDDGLAAVCARAFRLGYGGKLLIHPRQVPIARAAFAPDSDALRLANETIAAYEEAAANGRGAIRVRGRMVDRPMIDRARALTARFGRVLQ